MDSIVVGAAVGTIVAIVGAIGNYIATSKRDEQQRAHELRVLLARWDREDGIRYHQERLTAYRNILNASSEQNLGVSWDKFHELFEIDMEMVRKAVDDIVSCNTEIQLIAASDQVRQEASALVQEADHFRYKADNIYQNGVGEPSSAEEFRSLIFPVQSKHDAFQDAAREELGIPIVPPASTG
jgi:hypothetical protein